MLPAVAAPAPHRRLRRALYHARGGAGRAAAAGRRHSWQVQVHPYAEAMTWVCNTDLLPGCSRMLTVPDMFCRVDPAAIAAYLKPQKAGSAASMAAPGQPTASAASSQPATAASAPFRPAAAVQASTQSHKPQQRQGRPPPYQPPGSSGSWTAVGRPVNRLVGDPWDD